MLGDNTVHVNPHLPFQRIQPRARGLVAVRGRAQVDPRARPVAWI